MKVKANAVGFYGGSLRQPGQVFEVADDFTASWAEPVPAPAEPVPAPADKPADKPVKGKAAKVADDLV